MGVGKDAGKRAIDQAFKNIVKNVHPDKQGSNEAMQELNVARDLLVRAKAVLPKLAQDRMKALPPAPPAIPTVAGAEGVHFVTPKKVRAGAKNLKKPPRTTFTKDYPKAAQTILRKQLAKLNEETEEVVGRQRTNVNEILKKIGLSGKVGTTARTWGKARSMSVVADQPKGLRVGGVA